MKWRVKQSLIAVVAPEKADRLSELSLARQTSFPSIGNTVFQHLSSPTIYIDVFRQSTVCLKHPLDSRQSMSVRIQFDQPSSQCYTNLDFVSGRVTLILPSDATISAVNVKLEAESRTRLAGPKDFRNERSEKKRVELEVHKVSECSLTREM